jgi:hypothetical protein
MISSTTMPSPMFRFLLCFRSGFLQGLSAPANLMFGRFKAPAKVKRSTVSDAWLEAGRFMDDAMMSSRHFWK